MTEPEQLTIETPEQIPLQFPLAGIGSRFLAVFFDTLVQFVVFVVFLVFAAVLLGGTASLWPDAWTWTAAILLLLFFGLYYGYFAFFEAIWNGQTPGKRYFQLRVIKETGHPITVYEAISRNLLRAVDQLPAVYAVGIVSVFFSQQNKRLGDYVAGTVVVHEKPLADVKPGWETGSPTAAPLYDAARLGLNELHLIETFLQRRYDLEMSVRRQAAAQIAEQMGRKLGFTREQRTSDETFLEEIAREKRNSGRYR
ncbi:MAG: RDD family protein [Acidobacteria bacterium]|nr:RDD family protein [Acidobacteriota bacterium]